MQWLNDGTRRKGMILMKEKLKGEKEQINMSMMYLHPSRILLPYLAT